MAGFVLALCGEARTRMKPFVPSVSFGDYTGEALGAVFLAGDIVLETG